MTTDSFTRTFHKTKEYYLKKPVFNLLLLSFILRIFYLTLSNPLWWDAYVYIGIGKFIYSHGKIGIWESFRPLVHPFILGTFWKLGLNPIIIGKLLDLIFSLISIYLVYLIGKKIYNHQTGLIAAWLFSLAPLFIMFTGLILTEPLAILLALLGFYYWIDYTTNKKSTIKLFCAGLILGFSFLTKFPQGLFFGGIVLTMLIYKQKILSKLKNIIVLTGGFLLPIIPYLILNNHLYNSPFEPFTSGSWIVTTATWLYGTGITYYFTHFFLSSPLYLFFFVYLYLFIKEKWYHAESQMALIIITILTIAYFTYVPRKEIRYMVTILPLITLTIGTTLFYIYKKIQKNTKPIIRPNAFIIICSILVVIHIPTALYFDNSPTFEVEINTIINENRINGTILVSDPSFVSFLNNHIVLLSGMSFAQAVYQSQKGQYELLFVNDCDLICPPENISCLNKKENILETFASENKEVFTQQHYFKSRKQTCTYYIYLPENKENSSNTERIINT